MTDINARISSSSIRATITNPVIASAITQRNIQASPPINGITANIRSSQVSITRPDVELDPLSLHLNQSTPQTIVGGIPLLESTRVINAYNQIVDKLYVDSSIDSIPTPDLSDYLTIENATLTYIPYSGATANVDLGFNTLTAQSLISLASSGASNLYAKSDETHYALLQSYKDFLGTVTQALFATDGLNFYVNNDFDDYFTFNTISSVPTIATVGDCNLKITASSGLVDFDNDNLITTGSIYLGNVSTYLAKDISGNMTFTDVVTGSRTLKQLAGIEDCTITRSSGLITTFAIGSRTIIINRDVDDVITGWEDTDNEWVLTRVGGIITGWTVT